MLPRPRGKRPTQVSLSPAPGRESIFIMKRQKYHFIVLRRFSSGLSFIALPGQRFGTVPVPAEANVIDAKSSTALTRARRKGHEGDVFFTTTLRQGTNSLVAADARPLSDADRDVTLSDARALFESLFPSYILPSSKIQKSGVVKEGGGGVPDENPTGVTEPIPAGVTAPARPASGKLYCLLSDEEAEIVSVFPGFGEQARVLLMGAPRFLIPDGFAGVRATDHDAYISFRGGKVQAVDMARAVTDIQGNVYIPVRSIK